MPTFKVWMPARITPDMADPGNTDPIPRYDGMGPPVRAGVPLQYGPAIVTPGQQIGNRWYGCTYFRPPYVIPGLGEIEP